MNNKFIYNNEGIGAVSILAVLNHMQRCSYAKSLLILPFFAHKQTTSFLKNKRVEIRSIEELLIKRGEFFLNFNDRYYSLLPVSLNSIILLRKLGAVNIESGIVYLNDNFQFDFKSKKLGRRTADIIIAAEKLANLLSINAEQLYLQLKIQL